MMIEKKFRVWNLEEHRWALAAELDEELFLDFECDGSGVFYLHDMSDTGHDRLILMQYTGLVDSKGEEIYEGDIVRFHIHTAYGWCDYWSYYVIEGGDIKILTDKQWPHPDGAVAWNINFNDTVSFKEGEIYKDIEVIGNIYERGDIIGK